MSYAQAMAGLGQVVSGQLAQTDPFVSKASLMASEVMLHMAKVSAPDRMSWLRNRLNGLWPRMGDEAVTKIGLISRSRTPDQAVFDAIRLVLANRLQEWAGSQAARGMSGLGDFAADANTFACTGASLSASTGGWVGAFRPGADTSIVGGANAGAAIGNCNLPTLRLQAEVAAQQAAAALEMARLNTGAQTNRTVLYAGVGIAGILALAVAAKIALK